MSVRVTMDQPNFAASNCPTPDAEQDAERATDGGQHQRFDEELRQ